MSECTFLIMAPHRVLTFAADGAVRSLSWSAWLGEVGWHGHYARLADGRLSVVDHARYRRDGPPGHDRDEVGRRRLWLDLRTSLFLAGLAGGDGVTGDQIFRLFEHRADGEAAWTDLCRFVRTAEAMKAALERSERAH